MTLDDAQALTIGEYVWHRGQPQKVVGVVLDEAGPRFWVGGPRTRDLVSYDRLALVVPRSVLSRNDA